MFAIRHLLAAACVLGGLGLVPGTARAAQSYDNCTGFIDSVPTTIGKAGAWCLRKDVSTANTSGAAITINANNVTIDCNDFKVGGLVAGDGSLANGIYADNRQNVTVRHCNVRGFYRGIHLTGGAGHLVEDNRLDNNLHTGIYVSGDNTLVQRNRVFDTGGSPGNNYASGITSTADTLDNTVSGVFVDPTINTYSVSAGIDALGKGTAVHGNRVRGLVVAGTGIARGILSTASGITIDGNQVTAGSTTAGYGILGGWDAACSNNNVVNYATNYYECAVSVHNISLPLSP